MSSDSSILSPVDEEYQAEDYRTSIITNHNASDIEGCQIYGDQAASTFVGDHKGNQASVGCIHEISFHDELSCYSEVTHNGLRRKLGQQESITLSKRSEIPTINHEYDGENLGTIKRTLSNFNLRNLSEKAAHCSKVAKKTCRSNLNVDNSAGNVLEGGRGGGRLGCAWKSIKILNHGRISMLQTQMVHFTNQTIIGEKVS